jgi:dihydrofolate reductase
MRKLVVSEFISLDGVMEAPGGDDGYVHGAWTIPYWCDELGLFKTAELVAADALLVGRVTYNGFAAAWPSRSGDEFTDKMNSMAKYVVSGSLAEASWNNTTILRGEMVDEIRALKAAPGADILVAGSAMLVQGLLAADLVDELRLAAYPVILGVGKKLFAPDIRLDFEVAASRCTETGVILTSFARVDRDPSVIPTMPLTPWWTSA